MKTLKQAVPQVGNGLNHPCGWQARSLQTFTLLMVHGMDCSPNSPKSGAFGDRALQPSILLLVSQAHRVVSLSNHDTVRNGRDRSLHYRRLSFYSSTCCKYSENKTIFLLSDG